MTPKRVKDDVKIKANESGKRDNAKTKLSVPPARSDLKSNTAKRDNAKTKLSVPPAHNDSKANTSDTKLTRDNEDDVFVGKHVAFAPVHEKSWMPPSQYKGVGSAYLQGVVVRATGKGKKKLYEVRWTVSDHQSTSHVHSIPAEKVREGMMKYNQLNQGVMSGECWQALTTNRMETVPLKDSMWDDFEEVPEDSRYVPAYMAPSNAAEVEAMNGLLFQADAVLRAPQDLYTHPDGETRTRLKPEMKHIFEHSASSSFFAFLPISFWRKVVEESNAYAANEKQAAITLEDMMKFLGILFYMALIDKGEYANYWGDQVENTMFDFSSVSLDNIMTLRQFKYIRKNLCFNNSVTAEQMKSDPLGRIRPLVNTLKLKGMKYCDIGRNVAVDEASVASRSRYARNLIVYNPHKPGGKYHFKIYMCCCSTTWLAINYRVHCHAELCERMDGVIQDPDRDEFARSTLVLKEVRKHVLEAVYPLHHSNRVVNTDNFYTSVQLLEALKLFGLFGRGTIRDTSKHAPKCFMLPKKDKHKLERGTSRQGVCVERRLVAASWVDNSIVNIVSNCDSSDQVAIQRRIGATTMTFQTPACISEYGKYMGGVDHLDQFRARFSIADGHSFRKWHKKFAMAFIDIARVNAFICRRMTGVAPGRDEHREFMINLITELLNGAWQHAVGDTGLMYNDLETTNESRVATPTHRSRPLTPSRLGPECDARSSKQVFTSRAKRECVVCRFEGRLDTIKTVYCNTHKVSVCMSAYPDHIDARISSDPSHTCWQKFHDFYLPRGLYNCNGNIRRSCPLFKARSRPESTQESIDAQSFISFDLNASFVTSVDFCSPRRLIFEEEETKETREVTLVEENNETRELVSFTQDEENNVMREPMTFTQMVLLAEGGEGLNCNESKEQRAEELREPTSFVLSPPPSTEEGRTEVSTLIEEVEQIIKGEGV